MTPHFVFKQCVEAARNGVLISRVSSTDKEYHFQNWFRDRLSETGLHFDVSGRNKYPDFSMVAEPEGYEIKGLAYPGRERSFDGNSQVPSGYYNGRVIYYVFGRYPKEPDGKTYPLMDLVICHGDFLNADHEYVHKNKSVKGFGSYGDILIRDRKMYVIPTPFSLVDGLAHQLSLILPEGIELDEEYVKIGELTRTEAETLIVGYRFNLETNEIQAETRENPDAGYRHNFSVWRLAGTPLTPVSLRHCEMEDETADDNDN